MTPRESVPVTRRAFVTATAAAGAALAAGTAGAASNATPNGVPPAPAAQPPRPAGRPMPRGLELGDPPARRVGLAVVGLGSYALGQILPRLAATRHLRLAAVVSGNPDKARAVAAAYGLPDRAVYSYDTFDRLRDDPSVDAVYLVTPPGLHAEHAVRAAGLGKHVLCEKPMAATSAECRQMVDACRRAGRQLMIGYRVYWEPHNVEAARLLRAGELGTLRQIVGQHGFPVDPTSLTGEWRVRRALSGGGSLYDIGIYSLNGTRWFAGEEPVEIRAAFRRPPPAEVRGRPVDVELGVDWTARFPSGLVATCISSYEHGHNRLQVVGDAGSLELEPATAYEGNTLRVRGGRSAERAGGGGERTPAVGPAERQFVGMLDEFARAVRENRAPRTPGEMGLRDVQLMELIYEAARTGRAVAVPAVG